MIDEPGVIPVGQELPPLHRDQDQLPARHQEADRPKGKTAGGRIGNRFAVLNAFIDFTMQSLTRAESLVWFALFRDTKADGLARTSQADLARRAGVNVGTVKRAVKGLRRRGLLAVVFRGSLRLGPSTYRVRPLARDGNKQGAPALPC